MVTKFFKVVTVKYFALDYADEELAEKDISVINNQPSKEVKTDWFETYSLGERHATRDSYEITNIEKIIAVELVNQIEE